MQICKKWKIEVFKETNLFMMNIHEKKKIVDVCIGSMVTCSGQFCIKYSVIKVINSSKAKLVKSL